MNRLRKRNELSINVKTGSREEFFARMLDEGKTLTLCKTIMFEDVED